MLEKVLEKEKYEEIVKYDLIDDLENIVLNEEALIKIDKDDIIKLTKYKLYAYYNDYLNDNLKLNVVDNNIKAKLGIVYIASNDNLTLNDTENIITKIKEEIASDIDLIFGTSIKENQKHYLVCLIYGE